MERGVLNFDSLRKAVFQYLLEIIGYGLWWVWLLMVLNTPMLNDGWTLHFSRSWLNLASVSSGAVISFFLAFGFKKQLDYQTKLPFIIMSAIILFISTIGVYLLKLTGMFGNAAAPIIAGSLMGVALSFLQIIWGTEFFRNLEPSKSCIVAVLSFAFALIVSVFALEKGPLSVIVASCSPVLSAMLLVRRMKLNSQPLECENFSSKKSSAQTDRNVRRKPLLPISLMLLLFFFALSFGVFRSMLPPAYETDYQSFYIMAFICIVPMAIVLLIGFLKIRNLNLALTIALGLITLGIFALSLFESENYAIESACMNSGVRCVDLVAWIMISALAREKAGSSMRVYGLGRGLGCLGALAGFVVGFPLSLHPDLALSASLLMLLVLLAVCAFHNAESGNGSFLNLSTSESQAYLQNSHNIEKPEEPESLTRTEAISLLAEENYLSQREQEVLELLVIGRSVGSIAQRLTIANSTVASHVRNIYRKLEIHNRQELLDMVEDYTK